MIHAGHERFYARESRTAGCWRVWDRWHKREVARFPLQRQHDAREFADLLNNAGPYCTRVSTAEMSAVIAPTAERH